VLYVPLHLMPRKYSQLNSNFINLSSLDLCLTENETLLPSKEGKIKWN
jgi:hypothetical protein